LWLDLQGYELGALKGSTQILKGIKLIYTEVSLKNVYHKAPLYKDFKKWLESYGFVVEKEFLSWDDMGNVLFKNSNIGIN
jgi:hypothetical protein